MGSADNKSWQGLGWDPQLVDTMHKFFAMSWLKVFFTGFNDTIRSNICRWLLLDDFSFDKLASIDRESWGKWKDDDLWIDLC